MLGNVILSIRRASCRCPKQHWSFSKSCHTTLRKKEKNNPANSVYVTVHYKPPVKSAPGQFYFIADSDRTYHQLSIDNCFKFIQHPEVELRFFEAWHVRIHKTEKTCLKVFILYTFLEHLHVENVSFQIFWSRNESWYFARSFKKDMNISNPLKSKFRQNTTFPCMYLYRKIKNADFTGGLWWTVTYSLGVVKEFPTAKITEECGHLWVDRLMLMAQNGSQTGKPCHNFNFNHQLPYETLQQNTSRKRHMYNKILWRSRLKSQQGMIIAYPLLHKQYTSINKKKKENW